MKTFDVTILTERRYVTQGNSEYNNNVYLEDHLVLNALKNLGLSANRKAWDDNSFNWSSTKAVVFRSTWDYFDRFSEFSIWLNTISKYCLLINSETLLRWNIDKHYLQQLKQHNIHIPETHFIKAGTTTTLKKLHQQLGWQHTVLKPCISGAARHTYKLNSDNLDTVEPVFQHLLKTEALMLQPFQNSVINQGELSLIIIDGQYSHAVLKRAKSGDFRVQDDFGGTVTNYTPTTAEINFAIKAVKACPELPIYARVDIITDNTNALAIAELELIEPELWFRQHRPATTALAKAIIKHIQ